MNQRIDKLSTHKDSFHLIFKDGNLTYTNTQTRDLTRINDMVALVEDFAEFLPDMEVHASLHDTGAHVLREDFRKEALRNVDARGCECLFEVGVLGHRSHLTATSRSDKSENVSKQSFPFCGYCVSYPSYVARTSRTRRRTLENV